MSSSHQTEPPRGPADLATFANWLIKAHVEHSAANSPLLTEDGVRYLRATLAPTAVRNARGARAVRNPAPALRDLPRWDAEVRKLWLGSVLLKQFRQPATNQTALLDAIQARGWAVGRVSNPLPREPGESEIEAGERLHETIKSLNRGMPPDTIHFRGDGSGQGVTWEYSSPRDSSLQSGDPTPDSNR